MDKEILKIKRVLYLLIGYVLISTFVFIAVCFFGYRYFSKKQHFKEIDVERINIVEKDGKLRMILANKERTPGPMERGVPFGYGSGNRVGMLFFNDEGTECGGLAFGSSNNGKDYEAAGTFAFDQYNQDQAIVMQYYESNHHHYSGISINEYPEGITNKERTERYEKLRNMPDGQAKQKEIEELAKYDGRNRVYLGKTRSGSAALILSDPSGKDRLRLRVDSLGVAHIEFLDGNGKIIKTLSP